jgi:lipoyl(octanoyl) transferase
MNIEIKKSIKPINYFDAYKFIGERLEDLYKKKIKNLFGIRT